MVPDGGQDLGLTMPCPPWRKPRVARLGLGWNPLMGRRLGPRSADEQRARLLCARARASCQWRQLANYTAGRAWPYQEALHARVGFYLVAFSLVFVFILVLF